MVSVLLAFDLARIPGEVSVPGQGMGVSWQCMGKQSKEGYWKARIAEQYERRAIQRNSRLGKVPSKEKQDLPAGAVGSRGRKELEDGNKREEDARRILSGGAPTETLNDPSNRGLERNRESGIKNRSGQLKILAPNIARQMSRKCTQSSWLTGTFQISPVAWKRRQRDRGMANKDAIPQGPNLNRQIRRTARSQSNLKKKIDNNRRILISTNKAAT
ncbi:hypothetical protein KM043_005411 [Ampulex compressa]|nr:hypothetical protein KM043_005411 [Ampulex compressa]